MKKLILLLLLLTIPSTFLMGCHTSSSGKEEAETSIAADSSEAESSTESSPEEVISAMNDLSNLSLEDSTEIAVTDSTTVYKSAEYEVFSGGTASMTVDSVNDQLSASILIKSDGMERDIEAAVCRYIISECDGFQSATLTIKSGPVEEYVYLYDLENSFSIEDTESAEKFGDFFATYGTDLELDAAEKDKVNVFISDAKNYLQINS